LGGGGIDRANSNTSGGEEVRDAERFLTPQVQTKPLQPSNGKGLNLQASISSSAASSTPLINVSPYQIFTPRDSLGSNMSAEEFASLKLEERIRWCRHKAFLDNMFETAAFWGSRLATMTGTITLR
jgi:hypothetical protein